MHEYALADGVLRAALATARREGLDRVTHLVVTVGELQQIRTEFFRSAIQEVLPSDEPLLRGLTVEVVLDPARFRCRVCERAFALAEAQGQRGDDESEAIHFVPELAHAFLACPGCGSPDFEMEGGRGVELTSVEGEIDDA